MDPELAQTQEALPNKKLKFLLLVGAIFLLLALGIFYVVVIRGGGSVTEGLQSILPFGNEAGDGTFDPNAEKDDKLGDIGIDGTENGERPRMWKIADGPVSGTVFKTLPSGDLAVRYVLREDGDIHEYAMESRTGRILANNAIPRVAEAVWDALGQSVVLRTATNQGDIISILGKLLPNPAVATGDEAPAVLEQSSLPENTAFISPGPDGGFVYTLQVGNELSIMLLDGSRVSTAETAKLS